MMMFITGVSPLLQLPWSRRVSPHPLQLRPAGSVDNLVIVFLPRGFVGEKTAELGEESLPVAGDVLHPQAVQDEFFTPVWGGGEVKSLTFFKCIASFHFISKSTTTDYDRLPRGNLLRDGVVLSDELQQLPEETETGQH